MNTTGKYPCKLLVEEEESENYAHFLLLNIIIL